MSEPLENYTEKLLEEVHSSLVDDDQARLLEILHPLHPSDIAAILDAVTQDERLLIWNLVDEDNLRTEILTYLHSDSLRAIMEVMQSGVAGELASQMDIDDLVEVMEMLPDAMGQEIASELDEGVQEQLVSSFSYDEGSAGRLMAPDVITIRLDVTIEVVLRFLRMRKTIPRHTDALMVVDPDGRFLGTLPVETLLTAQPEQIVFEVMNQAVDIIPVAMTGRDVAEIFEKHDLISAPVTDEEEKLLGRITIDDVIDIIREHADTQLLNMSSLDEGSDLFAPLWQSTRGRAIWLGVNLLTAFLASWVIGLFQGTLDKIVALAVLMPIVASMGGIAGSQTLTLTIRGLALHQVVKGNLGWLTRKEFLIGVINGITWSVIVGVVAYLWFGELAIGIIIAAAIILNLLAAAIAGILIPVLLNRFGQDPALSGSVILTTVTDVVGFLSFLGLATLFLA